MLFAGGSVHNDNIPGIDGAFTFDVINLIAYCDWFFGSAFMKLIDGIG